MGCMKIFQNLTNYQVPNPCLKQSVKALIVTLKGDQVFGSNHINNIVSSCPRVEQGCKTGEGYHLCKEVCNQGAHAEVDAINQAQNQNLDIKGGILYLVNHYYCCDNCLSSMKEAKLSKAIVLSEDGSVVKEYDLEN